MATSIRKRKRTQCVYPTSGAVLSVVGAGKGLRGSFPKKSVVNQPAKPACVRVCACVRGRVCVGYDESFMRVFL